MKLSENTLNVLKNFASINQGIVVKPGNTLRTISTNKTILAEATVEETFPNEFGIYDLNRLLSIFSLNKNNPEVTLEKEYLSFSSLGKIRLRYTASNLIFTPPNKNLNIPNYDVKFNLSNNTLNWIFSVASILKCPNIVVKSEGDDSDINIWAMDVKGEIVDDANIKVDGTSSVKFQATFKIENLKVLPGDYDVELSSVGVGKFSSKSSKLNYWISLEQNSSTFGK